MSVKEKMRYLRLNSKASHYEVKLNNLIKENEDLTNLIKEYKQEVSAF